MFNIDQTLIGRQYYTVSINTKYTIRGIYVLPDQKPILIGEYEDSQAKVSRLTTHRMEDVKFDLP
jgi:hypothetical protein